MEVKSQGIFITVGTSERWNEYRPGRTLEDLLTFFENIGYNSVITKNELYVTIEKAKFRVRLNVTELQFYVQFDKISKNDFEQLSKFFQELKNKLAFELGVDTEYYKVSVAYRLKSSANDKGTDQVLSSKLNPEMFFTLEPIFIINGLVKQFITNITTAFTIKG